jgi:hypothetical protein
MTKSTTRADADLIAGIEAGATADQTAAQMLDKIKTVDGSGSGLDADLLDGLHASAFAKKDLSNVAALPASVVAQLKGEAGAVGATFSKSGTTLYITT